MERLTRLVLCVAQLPLGLCGSAAVFLPCLPSACTRKPADMVEERWTAICILKSFWIANAAHSFPQAVGSSWWKKVITRSLSSGSPQIQGQATNMGGLTFPGPLTCDRGHVLAPSRRHQPLRAEAACSEDQRILGFVVQAPRAEATGDPLTRPPAPSPLNA